MEPADDKGKTQVFDVVEGVFKLRLDSRDYKLLYELDVDCRQSLARLATKIGVSKQRAAYRLKRLEAAGVVKGYCALIDSSRLGFLQLRTYISLRRADELVVRRMISFLKAEKAVTAIVRLAGPADLALGLSVRKHGDYHAFWRAFESEFKEFIAESRVAIYSPVYHFSKAYLVGSRGSEAPRVIGGDAVVEVDETDLRVLRAISRNSRLEAVKIAEEAGVSAEIVANRLKALREKGVIQGYRALIDVEKLGYEFYKVDFSLSRALDRVKVREYFQQDANAYQVNETIGGADVEVEFHVRNLQELLAKIEAFRKAFPSAVESFEHYRLLSEEKMTFFPE
ncbi:MAG: Lrp/AsnC family transcriptional regulator [Candidatus Norongarragalinales archaeon]